MDKKKLLLIDGNALAYRYYFALEGTGMKNSEGFPTWAVFGFFKCIFDLMKDNKVHPDKIIATFDVSKHTFRTDFYPEYKANRTATMPDMLPLQLEAIVEGLQVFNIPICTKAGYEADDLIGTLSKRASETNMETFILTGDRDSFQLVNDDDNICVIMPSKGELNVFNEQKVLEKMEVKASQIIDYKALAGDTSDNIPGIKGIGKVSAVKLLKEYENLENIYQNVENITAKKLKSLLIEGKESALISQKLATIDRNVDTDCSIVTERQQMPDKNEIMNFFKKYSLRTFERNYNDIISVFEKFYFKPEDTKNVSQLLFDFAVQEEEKKTEYKNYVEKKLIQTEEDIISLKNQLEKQTIISIDTETTGIRPMEDNLVGISLAYNQDIQYKNSRITCVKNSEAITKSFYIPILHKNAKQLSNEKVIEYLNPIFESENIKKTMQNAKFDMHVLEHNGYTINGLIFDTMLASYVNNPANSHGLKQQAIQYLNYEMKPYDELGLSKKQNFSDVDVNTALEYSGDDAFATLKLTEYWINNLDEKAKNLLFDIEIPTTLVLYQMEKDGISLDTEKLKEVGEEIQKETDKFKEKIFEEAGCEFSINSPIQVRNILFDKLQLLPKGKKKVKSNQSTNAEVLEGMAEQYPIAANILEYRKLTKLTDTYIEKLPKLISVNDNRVHTTFNQTITTTGRLSSSDPNLQNIPVKSDLGNEIRGCIVPRDKEKYVMLSADYSQIELRMLAHCSQDEMLMNAFNNDLDVHKMTASVIYGVPEEEVTEKMRSKGKTVNFAVVYGQSKYGLAKQLGITDLEAELFIRRYFQKYSGVAEYMNNVLMSAAQNGYVETIYGRKRYFDFAMMSSSPKILEAAKRAAINSPIQGSAADLMKIAMIDLQKSIKRFKLNSKIIIQVHDELVLEVLKSELETVKELTLKAMEANQPLTVPLKVDIAISNSMNMR